MKRTTFNGIILLLLTVQAGKAQDILECMEIIGFDVPKYVQADILLEACDTIVDVGSGYFEVFDPRTETTLCQVAKFNNKDGSILLGISGYYADMQCSNHPFHFYEISKSGNQFVSRESEVIFPPLDYAMFFTDSLPLQIIEKYLPEIKRNYLDHLDDLGSHSPLSAVLEEIYDYHIILPRKGTEMKVTLTVCDYLPRNEISFEEADWQILEEHIRSIPLSYDRCQRQFSRSPAKISCD